LADSPSNKCSHTHPGLSPGVRAQMGVQRGDESHVRRR
jgi:hypothetical protein